MLSTILNLSEESSDLDATTRFKVEFIAKQLRLIQVSKHGRRYSTNLVILCYTLFAMSSSCYEYLYKSKQFCLPTIRHLRNIANRTMDIKSDHIKQPHQAGHYRDTYHLNGASIAKLSADLIKEKFNKILPTLHETGFQVTAISTDNRLLAICFTEISHQHHLYLHQFCILFAFILPSLIRSFIYHYKL